MGKNTWWEDIGGDLLGWLKCKLRLCDDCIHCRTFICPWCLRRVSWDFGCDGDMPEACDDCWAEAHDVRI